MNIWNTVTIVITLLVVVVLGPNNISLQQQTVVNIKINLQQVKQWSYNLSNTLSTISKNFTAHNYLTENYNRYSGLHVVDGKDVLQKISQDIEKLLASKVSAVQKLVKSAETVYKTYIQDKYLNYEYINSKALTVYNESVTILDGTKEYVRDAVKKAELVELTPDPQLNFLSVSHERSAVHVPTNLFDKFPRIVNGAYWTRHLDDQFRKNKREDSTLTWQYFCSSDGFFRFYPGMKWPRGNTEERGIDLYDCRVRSWYLQAATCPKSVVILLDTSGSMKGLRMVIARSTVKHILNTLDDDDNFNIIKFSSRVEYVEPCFNETLMSASAQNKRRLLEDINTHVITAKNAKFNIAFEEAFRLLNITEKKYDQQKGRTLCNKAILLITDGVPEHYASVFEKWNWPDKKTRVFTFLIGREIDNDREVKWMACANKGFYSHISTLADVQEHVQNYIKVLSRPMVINRYPNLIWTSVYLDHLSTLDIKEGLQFMTSVAMPVFDLKPETKNKGNLLGVMGADVPISMLKELVPAYKLGPNGYAFMINNNGFVLFHPDFTPVKSKPQTKEVTINPYYNNFELTDVVMPVNRPEFNRMYKHMLSSNEGSAEIKLMMSHYDNMKRMAIRSYRIFYKEIRNTTFRLGIALPSTSATSVRTGELIKEKGFLQKLLNETNVAIAPWSYCRDLEPHLRGQTRIERLHEITSNDTQKCDQELLNHLYHDINMTQNILTYWNESSLASRERYGIELVFVGTKGGFTKYHQTTDTSVPAFLSNNTNTLEALYYKRAVEGKELLNNMTSYTFTYTVPHAFKGFNVTKALVTASAPIIKQEQPKIFGVLAVVGLQMKYKTFQRIFTNVTYYSTVGCSEYPCDKSITCQNEHVNCYLIDNHGYVVSSKKPEEDLGRFFGDVQQQVMEKLVQTNIFVGYNFTDYQALCDITANEKGQSNSASGVNPLKTIVNGMVWVLTEIALFMSQFSLTALLNSWSISYAESGECSLQQDIDYESLGTQERAAYNQITMHCNNDDDGRKTEKVIGHRPCHKTFILYKADLNMFQQSEALAGTVECVCAMSRCNDEAQEDCSTFCQNCSNPYAISWVRDTNLFLVIAINTCETCTMYEPHDFGLTPKELIHPDTTQCDNELEATNYGGKLNCYDSSIEEVDGKCGGTNNFSSTALILISSTLTKVIIFFLIL